MPRIFPVSTAFPIEQICVLPVGAEEGLFKPQAKPANHIPEALFFGTFIGLQGATYIAEAVAHYQGPVCRLTFLGTGPDRATCEAIVRRVSNPRVHVAFEEWVPLIELPARIGAADLCLGVFGVGDKTNRVIPNKVYQSLACDRPVITMEAEAYPEELRSHNGGLLWVPAGDPASIAESLSGALSTQIPGGVDAGVAFRLLRKALLQSENSRRTLCVTDSAGLAPEDRLRWPSASSRLGAQRRE
jgi:glycosyltransferase involved in cell wall biosynthesis